MREIKFRQRNKNNGQWHYWGMVDGAWVQPLIQDNYDHPKDSDQYTGLKNKQDKEIYEGDIIIEDGVVAAIEWSKSNACFCYKTETGFVGGSIGTYSQLDGFYGEIIGTVYENPELLDK